MDFLVSPAVLIPRPETEHVIETVLARVGRFPSALSGQVLSDWKVTREQADRPKFKIESGATGVSPVRIVDVGTGSGCIALALAKEPLHAEIHATDISAVALEIARSNAARLQLETRVEFHETDLLAGFQKNSFDFVVSNSPYVGESEADSVQLEVRKFEPRIAVFAGPTGLEVIARLIPQAHHVLKPGGWLVMEISGTIAPRVKELLAGWNNVQITNDLQGIERVVAAQKP